MKLPIIGPTPGAKAKKILTYSDSINLYRSNKNAWLSDSTLNYTPFNDSQKKNFKGLIYYEIDTSYIVKAVFTKQKGKKFPIHTCAPQWRCEYVRQYGICTFKLNGKEYSLAVYQNLDLKKRKQYKDHLFIPFKDLTNENETFYVGRYLEFKKALDGSIIFLDFNLAYNPYFYYNKKYASPIPTKQNTLNTKIKAGEKI